jgi:uncharacterized iron-regulated protein
MLKQVLIVGSTLIAMLCGLNGCGLMRSAPRVALLPEKPREAVRVFGEHGERVPWAVMLETVSEADVIVVGETHGHPLGLEAAASLWDDLLAEHPDAALLLEFFERDTQVALDDYLTDITDEAAFREAAKRTGGNYPAGHARMVEAAKGVGAPVIAANAPRRYIRKTTADGYDDLTILGTEQQRLFTVPGQLVEGRYHDDFFELMGGMDHGDEGKETEDAEDSDDTEDVEDGEEGDDAENDKDAEGGEEGKDGEDGSMPLEMIEKFYRSQQMWDATMADSVVRTSGAGHRPAVLVIGRFHSDFDGGTVQFIRQGNAGLRVLTLSMVASDEAEIAEEDLGRADFVLYVGRGPDAN